VGIAASGFDVANRDRGARARGRFGFAPGGASPENSGRKPNITIAAPREPPLPGQQARTSRTPAAATAYSR
jgi:hypothetical protein